LKGKKIYGSLSKASAIVDRVNFILADDVLVPVIFINFVSGKFRGFDDIYINKVFYGKVRGSLDQIKDIDVSRGSAGNKIGDTVQVKSAYGIGGLGRVSNVSNESSGEIEFRIEDGGYGYTMSTDILVSTQTLFIDNSDLEYNLLETVVQGNTTGIVIGQTPTSIGVLTTSNGVYFDIGEFETVEMLLERFTEFDLADGRADAVHCQAGIGELGLDLFLHRLVEIHDVLAGHATQFDMGDAVLLEILNLHAQVGRDFIGEGSEL
jgi:hypothetical protein